MDSVHSQVESSLIACFLDGMLNFLFRFCYHLFNPARMDPAVSNQFLEGNLGHFTAYRVKARKDNRFRGVVNYQVDAGGCFKCPDIATFPTDYPPLHFIRREGHYGKREEKC